MPTYEYRCVDCGERFEVVQSFTDPPLELCTVCGGKLRKVFHPVGIQFKGGGFYRSEARASPAAASKDKDAKTDAKPADKAVDKPAATPEPKSDSKPAKDTPKKVAEKSA